MFGKLFNQFQKSQELLKKLGFTLLILAVYRLLANIPLPGINPQAFTEVLGATPFNSIFSVISGGSLDQPSLVALGVIPYINASIIIQLLTTVIPHLEDLSNEGQTGRDRITQYTRLLTVPLAFMQSIMIYYILTNPQTGGVAGLIGDLNYSELAAFVLTLTAGSVFLMWLGEQITQYGLGNGASLIITFGIIAYIPSLVFIEVEGLTADWQNFLAGDLNSLLSSNFMLFYIIIAVLIVMTVFIVFFNEAVRKIPIRHATRYREGVVQDNYLPIRLNQAGVMPVIFAQALLTFPQILSSFAVSVSDPESQVYSIASQVQQSAIFQFNTFEYIITFVVMIIIFTFFYTFVVMKPDKIATDLQKQGSFVPGIRPGKSTIKYVNSVVGKLTIYGSIALAIIAITPSLLSILEGSQRLSILSGIGGTSLLIVVAVFMDSYRQAKSMESVQSYDIFK